MSNALRIYLMHETAYPIPTAQKFLLLNVHSTKSEFKNRIIQILFTQSESTLRLTSLKIEHTSHISFCIYIYLSLLSLSLSLTVPISLSLYLFFNIPIFSSLSTCLYLFLPLNHLSYLYFYLPTYLYPFINLPISISTS